MSTALIIMIAILVAYIIYMLMGSSGTKIPTYSPNDEVKPSSEPAKPQRAEKADKTPVQRDAPEDAIRFKNPETGETAANPTNYRFAKRWIKDALVSEGLLDRIYKNNELSDSRINKKVKKALDSFKGMEKYFDA